MVFQIGVANAFPCGVAKVFQIQVLQSVSDWCCKVFQIGVAKMFPRGVANVFECGVCKGISDWYLQRCPYFEKHLKLKSERFLKLKPEKHLKLRFEKCLKLKPEKHLKLKSENQI